MKSSREELLAEAARLEALKEQWEQDDKLWALREKEQSDFKAELIQELVAYKEAIEPGDMLPLSDAHWLLEPSDVEAVHFKLPERGEIGNVTEEWGTWLNPAPR